MDYALSYYQNLNDFYKKKSGLDISLFSSFFATIKPLSQFKSFDEITLPFPISGRLVSVGAYNDKRYSSIQLTEDALKPTTDKWVGIPIFTSHAVFDKVIRGDDVSINEIVGKITKTEWNDSDKGIDFYAEIYDKQIAYKMAHGLIRFISVGFARDIVGKGGEFFFMNIDPKESSLVFDPRDKKAEFKPAKQ